MYGVLFKFSKVQQNFFEWYRESQKMCFEREERYIFMGIGDLTYAVTNFHNRPC